MEINRNETDTTYAENNLQEDSDRDSNIIVFETPESRQKNKEERNVDHMNAIISTVSIADIEIGYISFFRLVKYVNNKLLPIKPNRKD